MIRLLPCKPLCRSQKALDTELAEIDAKLTEFTTTLPNIPAVIVSPDEDDNVGGSSLNTKQFFDLNQKLTGI